MENMLAGKEVWKKVGKKDEKKKKKKKLAGKF